jgi:aspartate ammonia-lyase
MATRTERDTLGEMAVPVDAYYGAQTARAVANFPISGLLPSPRLVWATLIIKKCAALANMATGRLPNEVGQAIVAAADEALAGRLADQFLVDPFQAGAGTSHNMNVNEVLANRAAELLGGERGRHDLVHPNDQVNMAQSTNDVFPTAMRLACIRDLQTLRGVLARLHEALQGKAEEFDGILKSGRTHLQDAVPIRLGQEFAAYARAMALNSAVIDRCLPGLCELGIGGTAVGTGLNAEPAYIDGVVAEIAKATGFPVIRGADLVERMQNMAPFVDLSAALKGLAINLGRIANDLRLLSSGPRTGFDEIILPAVQPGSSIMPGKVNPSMAEMLNMVCFQVMGADTTVTLAAQAGQLELNVMMPVIAHNLLFSLQILISGVEAFTTRCVSGITANGAKCAHYLESSLGLVTAIAPYVGYHAAAEVAQEAQQSGRTLLAVIRERGLLDEAQLARIMAPEPLTHPGVPGK